MLLTGRPMKEARTTVSMDANSMQKPVWKLISVMFVPTVRITRAPIAFCRGTTTGRQFRSRRLRTGAAGVASARTMPMKTKAPATAITQTGVACASHADAEKPER